MRALATASRSCRTRRTGADPDAVFDVRAVFQQYHDLGGGPTVAAAARKGRYGLIDYEKVFAPGPRDDIFDLRGIDREQGALVVVRPDQYVAHVLPLDAPDELAAYLAGFMREPATA